MPDKHLFNYLSELYLPKPDSHKGQNGRLLIIGGSQLFHAASLWALQVASRIVDLVHYSSVVENNELLFHLKKEFRNGIIVPRADVESYIEEDDCILIGPGMLRSEAAEISNIQYPISNIGEILKIENEGIQTYFLTKYLLKKYPKKKWVIDAGALQMMDLEDIPPNAILIPHHKEFEGLLSKISVKNKPKDTSDGVRLKQSESHDSSEVEGSIRRIAKEYNCTVLLKGKDDIVASKDKLEIISGGNAGMTKGGTGDVLAGLTAGLYCKNDVFTSAVCASLINKKAGEELYGKMGFWFNASDLANQVPQTMKKIILS